MSAPHFALTGGGTGGHLFPAQALAEALVARGARASLITDARGARFVSGFPGEVTAVRAATFAGRGLLGKLAASVQILIGTAEAAWWIARARPVALIGFGGYPALPGTLAAILTRTPIALHDQNAVFGRVNRRFGGFAKAIAGPAAAKSALPEGLRARFHPIGAPVREAVRARAASPYEPPKPGGPIRLLVFGGSQGAQIFARLIPAALAETPSDMRARLAVVHQAREEDVAPTRAAYERAGAAAEIAPFFADLPARVADAHFVVARAGASSVAEIATIGRPALFIPLPGALDDHQTANAAGLADAGAALSMPQKALNESELARLLMAQLGDSASLVEMARKAAGFGAQDAAERLADLAFAVAGLGAAGGARG